MKFLGDINSAVSKKLCGINHFLFARFGDEEVYLQLLKFRTKNWKI